MAYDAVPMAAGLPVHHVGRQPEGEDPDLPQSHDHDVAGWTLARRCLAFCDMGWTSRRRVSYSQMLHRVAGRAEKRWFFNRAECISYFPLHLLLLDIFSCAVDGCRRGNAQSNREPLQWSTSSAVRRWLQWCSRVDDY